MLKEEIYGSLNPKQTEYIAGILTSGNHLLELINNYLDMAKIDANREELYRENNQLKSSQSKWQDERVKLREKNDLARSRVDNMISRLKSLEQES